MDQRAGTQEWKSPMLNREKKRNEASLKDLCDNIMLTHIHVYRGPRRSREKGTDNTLEDIIAEKLP